MDKNNSIAPAVIKLKYPIGSLTELSMRRVKVRDQLAANRSKGNESEKEIFLFASLCEVTTEQIETMDMADYMQIQEVYSGFLD